MACLMPRTMAWAQFLEVQGEAIVRIKYYLKLRMLMI